MEVYTDQLKNAEYQSTYIKEKRAKVKACTDILTFDIEVTSAWMDPGRGLIAYEPGHPADFWNEKKAYSLCYIWQFSFNDHVYYGRELKDFIRLLEDLPQDQKYIIWVHNLSYEFAFLINYISVYVIFARTPHKPIYCIFSEFKNIEFRCSYMLANMSLEKWGLQLGIEKLSGYLDYNKMRTPLTELTPEEMAYCERDCIVVYHGILDHLKQYKNIYDIPTTSTGKVRRPVKELVTADYKYMADIKKTIPRDCDEYILIKSVFAGGYTHGNRKYLDKIVSGQIHHVDIASSYPYCIFAYKYPYNKWTYLGKILPNPATFESKAYMIKLHFTNIRCIAWNTYISGAKSRGSGYLYDNGRVLCAKELYITVTEQDYITICNTYEWDHVESEGTWICHKRYLPTIFINYLMELYKNKTSLKGIEDPSGMFTDLYNQSKAFINSMFGMMVTSPFQAEVKFNSNDQDQWSIEQLTSDYINNQLDKMRIWYNRKWFLSYSVGCWITAYARRRLWSCIEKCDKDLLYTDTDSLFYINDYDWEWFNNEADNRLKAACEHHKYDFEITRPKDTKGKAHPLGYLDREADCIQFKTLGAKKYIERREDNKLYMTVSGINKDAVQCLNDNIDNFRDGFTFDKDHPGVRKQESAYLTDMEPVVWPDGYKSDCKYGISMRPTGYTLSVPTIYSAFLNLYEYITNPSDAEIIRRRGRVRQ